MAVFGYVRTSTSSQLELSPEQQRHEIAAWCSKNDLPEPVFYADEGVSGMKTQERAGYQALLKACQTGDVVVTYDLSRLGRRAKEVLSALDLFREQSIRYISIRQGLDSSSIAATLVYGVLAVVNEMMVLESRSRTQSSIDYLKSKGFKTGGTVPFGMDVVEVEGKKKLVPNKQEYDTIVLINRLRASGMSFRAIAKALDDRGIKSKLGKTWHPSAVRNIVVAANAAEDCGVHDGDKDDEL